MGYLVTGKTGDWETVIGLEVHAQVVSSSKLFSGAAVSFGDEANTQVSLVDAALPGMLPVLNRVCVEQAVRTGLGLRAHINKRSVFARKNYFYADLPQGYQISQFDQPIVSEGEVTIDMGDGSSRVIGVERLHLEQDAGKLIHDRYADKSLIDFNRCGVALMEIVSRPDMRSPEEAGACLRKLRTILRYLGTCDGNMDEGSMRCDVNVSTRPAGADELRTRCEVKNVNSVRFVMQAIDVEARRQVAIYEQGGEVAQETRLFDPPKGETRPMRSKEHAQDYRYFPCPDLPPLVLDDALIETIGASLPELPDDKKRRFIDQYAVSSYDAAVLAADREIADYFEEVAAGRDGRAAAAWVSTNLFGALNKAGLDIAKSPVTARHLGALIDLIATGVVSTRLAKDVFDIMWQEGGEPGHIVEARGLRQVTDISVLETACDEMIAAHPDKVEQIKNGKDKLLGWFIGQVMQKTRGKANPQTVRKILRGKL